MIYGMGIDVIEIKRIEKILCRKEKSFISKILSDNETEECPINIIKKTEYVSGRFAGKEAVAKAFGTGIGGEISWKDIEILNYDTGKPFINIKNDVNSDKFIYHISISHTRTLAIAQVIIEYR